MALSRDEVEIVQNAILLWDESSHAQRDEALTFWLEESYLCLQAQNS